MARLDIPEPQRDLFGEQEIRALRYKEFVINLLDDRHNVEQMLSHRATASHATYQGYRADDYLVPEYLRSFSTSTAGNQPEGAEIDFTVSQIGKNISVNSVTISTDDRLPVFIHNNGATGATRAEEGLTVSKLEGITPETVLRSFLPDYLPEDLPVDKVVQAFGLLSPEYDRVTEFRGAGPNFHAYIAFFEAETYRNSIQSLVVENERLHPSGAVVTTRLRITESLLGRMLDRSFQSQSVNQALAIQAMRPEPQPEVTIEELDRRTNKYVEAPLPTRRHIQDIQAALRVLKRAQP